MSEIKLLFANLLITALLTGFVWFVQIVQYPGFKKVGVEAFPSYHALHTRGTGYVAALPMILELGLAVILLFVHPSQPALPWSVKLFLAALAILIWIVTFGWAVPLHEKLAREGYSASYIEQLVMINWSRTIAWTLRFLILSFYGSFRIN